LEGDEKEFTQTATSVRERTSSEEVATRQRSNLENGERGQINDLSNVVISASNSSFDALGHSSSQIESEESEYDDYFSSHILQTHDHGQDLDAASAAALFGASPSPSLLSDLSSLSSATSATSDAEPGDDMKASMGRIMNAGVGLAMDLVKGKNDMNATIAAANPTAQMASMHIRAGTGVKRTIGMLGTELVEQSQAEFEAGPSDSDVDAETSLDIMGSVDPEHNAGPDTEMCDPISILKPVTGLNISVDTGMESWNDLRSPETVEIDELDEIFADV
jgi:hypothetical protein